MATFNTTKASKAWKDHNKDLQEVSKLTNVQARYATVSEKLDASQAKLLNSELLKMSKAIGKAIDGIGKQQAAIVDKQKKLDELEQYQFELSKEIKELSKDQKMDAKARDLAIRKNEAEIKSADRKVAALHAGVEDLSATLDERFDEFDSDLDELESELKLSVDQASTKLGKHLLAKAAAEAKEKQKKDLIQAKLDAKNLREVLDNQMAEVKTAMKSASNESDRKQLDAIHAEMAEASKALVKKDYAKYLIAAKKLSASEHPINQQKDLAKRLDSIEDRTRQEQDLRKEIQDKRWDRIEKVAGMVGLSRTASLFRPKEKTGEGLGTRAAGALGLSNTYAAAKKGLSYGSGVAKGAGRIVGGTAKLGMKGLSALGSIGKKGFGSIFQSPARISSPESPAVDPMALPRNAKGQFVKRSHLPQFAKKPNEPKGKSIASAATVAIGKPSTQASDARAEEQGNEEAGLLRRQVAALEKIAGSVKKGGSKGEGGGFGMKSMWNLFRKFGGKLLGRFGGLLTRALAFVAPALSAIAGPLAVVAGAAAVAYSTYKATTWIMDKLNIDPGKLGTGLYDMIHGGDEKKQAAAQAQAEAEAAARGRAKREAAKQSAVVQTPVKLPDSGMGGGRGSVNPAAVVPEADTGKSLAQAAQQASGSAVSQSEAYTPEVSTASNVSAAPTPPATNNPIVIPQGPTSPSSAGAGRGKAYMDAAGTSLSEAAGKLFRTSKSGDALDKVNPGVQSNFTSMAAEYKANGGKGNITLNSAYRSDEEQAKLYKENPGKAAKPGKSAHGTGLAIDINSGEANELDKMGLLSKYGFSRPVKGEAWHLQAAGTSTALAKAGAISADNSTDQAYASNSSGGKGAVKAAPVSETVPPPPKVSEPGNQIATGAMDGRQQMGVAGSAPKGSTSTIPTFSYMDGGFFIMNAGMLTA